MTVLGSCMIETKRSVCFFVSFWMLFLRWLMSESLGLETRHLLTPATLMCMNWSLTYLMILIPLALMSYFLQHSRIRFKMVFWWYKPSCWFYSCSQSPPVCSSGWLIWWCTCFCFIIDCVIVNETMTSCRNCGYFWIVHTPILQWLLLLTLSLVAQKWKSFSIILYNIL